MPIGTTYFLGAGASKALDHELPLARELTLQNLLTPSRFQVTFNDRVIDNVKEYLASQNWPTEDMQLPFEEVFARFPEKLKPLYPRENLLICLFWRLESKGNLILPVFDSWLEENLSSEYPVLTTNYDTVIEWGFEMRSSLAFTAGAAGLVDYGVPADLCLPPPTASTCLPGGPKKLQLLKLYGSLGWCQCQKCGKYRLETINEAVAVHTLMGYGTCRGADCGGTRHDTVLVPLVGEKIPDNPALRAIWARSKQVLSESRHIVFVGFSLNRNDQGVWDLLRRADSAGHTDKVTVVLDQSNPEILERYREIYHDRVQPYDLGWRQYLKYVKDLKERMVGRQVAGR